MIEALVETAKQAREAKDFTAARSAYLSAYEEAATQNNQPACAYVLRHLADVSLDLDMAGEALEEARQAHAIYDALGQGETVHAANALRLVAIAQGALGDNAASGAAWTAARKVYEAHSIEAGVKECDAALAQD